MAGGELSAGVQGVRALGTDSREADRSAGSLNDIRRGGGMVHTPRRDPLGGESKRSWISPGVNHREVTDPEGWK